MFSRAFGLFCIILLLNVFAKAQTQTSETVKIAEGIYAEIFSEPRVDPVEPNSIFIIGKEYVIVMDANRTPDSARKVIAKIRKITDKPVRYVINSHWHDDHIFGNQAYREAFPNVEFIAQKNTREDMESKAFPHIQQEIDKFTKEIPRMENLLAKGVNENGQPLSRQDKEELQAQIAAYKEYLPKIRPIKLVLSTITFENKLTIFQDAREVRILNFGRGNTRGDAVVYLPKEKILLTGDLLVAPVPYAYGSFIGEWIETMKKLRELDADVIIPGHGPVMRNKDYMNTVIALLESIYKQVKAGFDKGLSLEEIRKTLDVESYRNQLAGSDRVRKENFDASIIKSAVDRTYKELKGELPAK